MPQSQESFEEIRDLSDENVLRTEAVSWHRGKNTAKSGGTNRQIRQQISLQPALCCNVPFFAFYRLLKSAGYLVSTCKHVTLTACRCWIQGTHLTLKMHSTTSQGQDHSFILNYLGQGSVHVWGLCAQN